MKKVFFVSLVISIIFLNGCQVNNCQVETIKIKYNQVLLGGTDISGVWAVVEESYNKSDFYDNIAVESIVILDGNKINLYEYDSIGSVGFKDDYLYNCSLNDFELEDSNFLDIVGQRLYIAGEYEGDIALNGNALHITDMYDTQKLVKVKGFKLYANDVDVELPKPLSNEIVYQTNHRGIVESRIRVHSNQYNSNDDYGKIVYFDNLYKISSKAFARCYTLTSISIPDGVHSIGEGAFSSCSNLKNVIIGNGVTAIENCAFEFCYNLKKVIIPQNVTSIGRGAFYGSWFMEVYCQSTTPPAGAHSMFSEVLTIYVPKESVDAYKKAKYWKEYADYIVGYDFE